MFRRPCRSRSAFNFDCILVSKGLLAKSSRKEAINPWMSDFNLLASDSCGLRRADRDLTVSGGSVGVNG